MFMPEVQNVTNPMFETNFILKLDKCYKQQPTWLDKTIWSKLRMAQGSSTLFYVVTVNSRYLEVDGTIFYKFKLPEVQINLQFG